MLANRAGRHQWNACICFRIRLHPAQSLSTHMLYSPDTWHRASLNMCQTTLMSQYSSNRPRVSAAVLRADRHEVLMVQHRRPNGTTYWQLPGGGIEADEHSETAVLRELAEETGLAGRVVQQLFVIPYKYGLSTTYLVAVDDPISLHLGYDPEERDAEHQKLAAVTWQRLDMMGDNPEIEALKQALGQLKAFSDGTEEA
jgi:8-oxo-dGTP pyrophosphatase MutT (NUDIX family)